MTIMDHGNIVTGLQSSPSRIGTQNSERKAQNARYLAVTRTSTECIHYRWCIHPNTMPARQCITFIT